MLRTIWMIIEGVLAAIGVFAIVIYIKGFKQYAKHPELLNASIDIGEKIFGDKQT